MTERLYDLKPLVTAQDTTFRAKVQKREPRAGKTALVLDRTLFYPTSGGQPCDHGELDGKPVVEVLEEGETIVHLVEGEGGSFADEVVGRVDLARRRDHMEQHSGQHLLSAILARRFKVETLSFHLGADVSTIDVKAEDVSNVIGRAEEEVNAAIRANAPVTATVFPREAAGDAARSLRKPPEREALESPRGLRVVSMGENGALDRDACCGTHVASTGELGLLLVLGTERGKKGTTRVHFVVGGRALRAARARLSALDATASELTTGALDVPARVTKLLTDVKTLRKERTEARERAIAFEAEATARAPGVVTRLLEGGDPGEARTFASAVTRAHADAVVAVVHQGEKATLVIASPRHDSATILKSVLAPFGGKGGGNATFAQGAAADGSKAKELLEAATKLLG